MCFQKCFDTKTCVQGNGVVKFHKTVFLVQLLRHNCSGSMEKDQEDHDHDQRETKLSMIIDSSDEMS